MCKNPLGIGIQAAGPSIKARTSNTFSLRCVRERGCVERVALEGTRCVMERVEKPQKNGFHAKTVFESPVGADIQL